MFKYDAQKKAVDNGKKDGTVLTDLSKDFDCLNHQLLIVKFIKDNFLFLQNNTSTHYADDNNHAI